MRDNFNEFDVCQIQDPATKTATFQTEAFDMSQYESATLVASFAESGDTLSGSVYITVTLQESDSQQASYAAVDASEIVDGTTSPANSIVVDAGSEDGLSYKLGYTGNARYIRANFAFTGTHTYGTIVSAYIIAGHKRTGPYTKASYAALASS